MTRQLIERFRAIVGDEGMLCEASDLLVYECDGYVVEKNVPDVVLLPTTREQVVAIVKTCNEFDVPFVPRGAGTSLSGGCLPVGGGVMIALTRMKRILEVNLRDRYAVVEPGLVNVHLTQRLKGTGYHYAPDPSSQGACTIGGNVATNSGGPHTLKYGVTVNHVLGVESCWRTVRSSSSADRPRRRPATISPVSSSAARGRLAFARASPCG